MPLRWSARNNQFFSTDIGIPSAFAVRSVDPALGQECGDS